MRNRVTKYLMLCALGAWLGTQASAGATTDAQANRLPAPVTRALLKRNIPHDGLSVFVQEIGAAKPRLDFAGGTARNPASAIKLFTTLAALHELGPAFTWSTTALANAPVSNGRLQGDLFIRGGGDPFLVTERFWKFLLELKHSGVQHIEGDLVIDNGYFAPSRARPGDFDGRPYRPYNVLPKATLLNFGATRFWLTPNDELQSVDIVTDPPSTTLAIVNSVKLVDKNCANGPNQLGFQVISSKGSGQVEFAGPFPNECGRYTITRAVSEATSHLHGAFDAIWKSLGGTLGGSVREGTTPDDAQLLHSYKSPPLSEVIRTINKYSNNVMSRHLLLTLGARHFGPPGTPDKGRRAVASWLDSTGLDFPELFVDNGAGLSRKVRVSARSLGQLLLTAHASPLMPEFVSSLPLSAVDGTLRRRFKDEPIAGRLHVKTGTIDDVRAMAGYLLAKDGRTYVVVTLHNYPGVQYGIGTEVQNALLRWLYDQ